MIAWPRKWARSGCGCCPAGEVPWREDCRSAGKGRRCSAVRLLSAAGRVPRGKGLVLVGYDLQVGRCEFSLCFKLGLKDRVEHWDKRASANGSCGIGATDIDQGCVVTVMSALKRCGRVLVLLSSFFTLLCSTFLFHCRTVVVGGEKARPRPDCYSSGNHPALAPHAFVLVLRSRIQPHNGPTTCSVKSHGVLHAFSTMRMAVQYSLPTRGRERPSARQEPLLLL